MKRLIVVIISLTVCLGAFSQNLSLASSVVSISCGYTSATYNGLSWTVGEPVVDILTSTNYILTVGFQQNWEKIVGIEDLEEEWHPGVYPNPGTGTVFVKTPGNGSSEVLIELFDLRGAKIYSERKNNILDDELITLDISNLEPGMYFLHIYYPGGIPSRVYKLIKK
jgi:hypothetical protein